MQGVEDAHPHDTVRKEEPKPFSNGLQVALAPFLQSVFDDVANHYDHLSPCALTLIPNFHLETNEISTSDA